MPEEEGAASFSMLKDFFNDEESLVSRYNTDFIFNDFGVKESIALTELDRRFVEGDPRLDLYMLRAADYFETADDSGNPYEIFYVKSRLSAMGISLYLKYELGKASDDWIFPEFNKKSYFVTVSLFLICWFYCVWISKGLRMPVLIAGIPWFAAVISAGAAVLPGSVIFYMIFVMFFRETFKEMLFYLNYREMQPARHIVFYTAAIIAALVAVMLLSDENNMPLMQILAAAASDFLFIFMYYSIKSQKVRMQEHQLFFPVSLASGNPSVFSKKKLQEFAASAAALIVLPMFLLFIDTGMPIDVPVPEHSVDLNDWSIESLEFISDSNNGLVNASDIIKHEAYQNGFMYGMEYFYPDKDYKLMSGRYILEDNEVVFTEDCIWQFTDEWYTSIINQDLKTGLPALLLSQRTPGDISKKSDISKTSGTTADGFSPVRHIIISLLALLPATFQFFDKVRINFRRKDQEA